MNTLAARAAHWQKSPGCMLTFHRAAPSAVWAGLPNRGFHLDLGYLNRLLIYLRNSGWEVVTVDEMLGRLNRGEPGERLVNFSVDDCYKDTWEHVVPLFRKHGVPVTLFVTTGIPDNTLELYWAVLESILAERASVKFEGITIDVSAPPAKREAFRRIAAVWDRGSTEARYLDFCRVNGADPARLRADHAITWEMLESFRDDKLVEIGAHTVSHPRVGSLSAQEALTELRDCGDRLRSRLGVPCRHFAFPYGRSGDCGPRDFALAREAGFASASTTRKGLLSPEQDVFSLPRNTLNGSYQSIAYANTLLSGLAGFGARVFGRV
jgi:peptidoglycan/xylan/chitin deacetylase (PgdA/CDA1 family)